MHTAEAPGHHGRGARYGRARRTDPPGRRVLPLPVRPPAATVPRVSEETEKERLDRELIELLNELRVALPGVQVLFAFLLGLPFTQRFEQIDGATEVMYVVSLVSAAAASAFLIAPSAHHRLRWRSRDKERLLRTSNRQAIAGTALLAVGIS